MTATLLLIDLQRDYFPGGAMVLDGADAAVACASGLLSKARGARMPVVHVQHISDRPGATFFLPGTAGAEFHPDVAPREGEELVVKHFPNSFRGTDLHARLQAIGTRELVIAGMMTHMCIAATTRAAFDLGYGCTVVGDACATRALVFQDRRIDAADVHGAHLAALSGLYAGMIDSNAWQPA